MNSLNNSHNNYELFYTTEWFHLVNFICKHTLSLFTLIPTMFFIGKNPLKFLHSNHFSRIHSNTHPPKEIPSIVYLELKTIHFPQSVNLHQIQLGLRSSVCLFNPSFISRANTITPFNLNYSF
jgi:hypothetical protein